MAPSDKPHETSITATLALPFTFAAPLLMITAYRMIPAPVRAACFPGPSTSLAALAAVYRGESWAGVRRYAKVVR